MLFVSSTISANWTVEVSVVSISESRCFSFQVSSCPYQRCPLGQVSISESRCFSFQVSNWNISNGYSTRKFQSRNRDAFRFKGGQDLGSIHRSISFQSRNRDAFRFKKSPTTLSKVNVALFQSRNRDAFRFKLKGWQIWTASHYFGFNLGIEMLFVSRASLICRRWCYQEFQSRNRDAFRFK